MEQGGFLKCCQKQRPSFKNTARSVTVQKNNKQRIVEVNRDFLNLLINLSAGSGLVAIYKMVTEYSLSPVLLNIPTTDHAQT